MKTAAGLAGFLAALVGHNSQTVESLEEFKVLILGVSTDIDAELTDTIMVASYNPKTQKATLLSIPRDTNTNSDPTTTTASDKINSLYNQTGGAEKTLAAVNEITGLGIKHYVVVKTEALVDIVDEIGGVEFDVPINMNYTSASQGLNINLREGVQNINGEEAEWLLRFRHNNDGTTYPAEYGIEDVGRMRTGREFIIETAKQVLSPHNILKLIDVVDIAKKNIVTNLEIQVIKDYIPYVVELNTDNIETAVLPGEDEYLEANRVWVFSYNEEETKELIEEKFIIRDLSSEEKLEQNIITKGDITIEVINASGTTKKLEEVVDKLEKVGYKVTRTGKSDTTTKTKIIVKQEIPTTFINNIKETLGTGQISEELETYSQVHYTVIIGKDYQ